MTLVIALRCTDGLVMASDGMSTEAAPLGASQITKHETADKIVIHKDLLWGASGSVGVKQVVQNEIEKDYGKGTIYLTTPTFEIDSDMMIAFRKISTASLAAVAMTAQCLPVVVSSRP
jgi:hypothetical protein